MKQQKADRQLKLKKEFGFVCNCEACSGNFPTPPALKFKDMKLLKYAKKTADEILLLSPSQALKKYHECCRILEENHENFPSIELCLLQKTIALFLLLQSQPSTLFP